MDLALAGSIFVLPSGGARAPSPVCTTPCAQRVAPRPSPTWTARVGTSGNVRSNA